MPESTSDSMLRIRSLILGPSLITLGVTLLRLAGELAHWSPRFFSPAAGGGMAVIGISWLPFLFGPYFAVKLARAGQGASDVWKAFGFSLVGLALMVTGGFVGFAPQVKFAGKEGIGILLMMLGPTVITFGWPALFKALVAYAYAARVPVAVVMLFALRGHWGTHYDAVPRGFIEPPSFLSKYLVIAFLPQMVIWIIFTVVVGALIGSFTVALVDAMPALRRP